MTDFGSVLTRFIYMMIPQMYLVRMLWYVWSHRFRHCGEEQCKPMFLEARVSFGQIRGIVVGEGMQCAT